MLFQVILVPTFLVLVLGFPLLSHPLSMGVTLLMLVIVVSFMVGVSYSTLWVSYAAVLILLGGLLVIFIYVSLLASNEVFKINNFFTIPASISLFSLFFVISGLSLSNETTSETLVSSLETLNSNSLEWLTDFYSKELHTLTLFLVFYLLLTLLVVVFNTKKDHGTLRSSS